MGRGGEEVGGGVRLHATTHPSTLTTFPTSLLPSPPLPSNSFLSRTPFSRLNPQFHSQGGGFNCKRAKLQFVPPRSGKCKWLCPHLAITFYFPCLTPCYLTDTRYYLSDPPNYLKHPLRYKRHPSHYFADLPNYLSHPPHITSDTHPLPVRHILLHYLPLTI